MSDDDGEGAGRATYALKTPCVPKQSAFMYRNHTFTYEHNRNRNEKRTNPTVSLLISPINGPSDAH